MLLHVARVAYVVAALAALAAAVTHREHRRIAAVLVAVAVLFWARLLLPTTVDAYVVSGLPGVAACASVGLLLGRWWLGVLVGLGVAGCGVDAIFDGATPAAAHRWAHGWGALVEVAVAVVWCRQRHGRAATLADAAALVLVAGDVALAVGQPIVACVGWPAAAAQAIGIMLIVTWIEVTATRRKTP